MSSNPSVQTTTWMATDPGVALAPGAYYKAILKAKVEGVLRGKAASKEVKPDDVRPMHVSFLVSGDSVPPNDMRRGLPTSMPAFDSCRIHLVAIYLEVGCRDRRQEHHVIQVTARTDLRIATIFSGNSP